MLTCLCDPDERLHYRPDDEEYDNYYNSRLWRSSISQHASSRDASVHVETPA